jgi:diguanylate cyclase (GGDEF)-like protein
MSYTGPLAKEIMPNEPDVLLVTTDVRLRDAIERSRPATATLRCVVPSELPADANVPAAELWLDLDTAPVCELLAATRRVYFHSPNCFPNKHLPSGLFIRKPCTEAVAHVLWSGVTNGVAPREMVLPEEGTLPAWILEYQEIGLREFCRKCTTRLGPRLGYADASLYLHDQRARLLTLAETTHTRTIDVSVPVAADRTHLMASVARTGRALMTTDAKREREARGLAAQPGPERYPDGSCLVAPLASEGRLWGILNLTCTAPSAVRESKLALDAIVTFLGRALQHARVYEQARTEARVDALTGLYNQRWMVESLTREIRRSQRYKSPLSVILAALDGLKAVNDRFGHPAGDHVLRHTAGRISTALRQFDSAARIGGDEFAILLPATHLAGARHVARRVLNAVRNDAAVYRCVPLPVRASLGVVEWQTGWTAAQLIESADKAMYLAKRRGRDQLVCQTAEPTNSRCAHDNPVSRLWAMPEVAPVSDALGDDASQQCASVNGIVGI